MLAILFGIIMGFVHFFSDRLGTEQHRMKTVSFVAGMFITYLFLHLFPHLYQGTAEGFRLSMVFALLGFTLIHTIEKFVYKHEKSVNKLRKDLRFIHSITFFMYHVALGMLLVGYLAQSVVGATLFFMPVYLFAAISSISMKQIHTHVRSRGHLKLMLSFSTLIGVAIATFFCIPQAFHNALLGLIVGTMMHVLIMDAIPKEREGRPIFFLLGVIAYGLLITFTWGLM